MKMEVNTITIKLWNEQEFGVYVKNLSASIEDIVELFLEVWDEYTLNDIQGIFIKFVDKRKGNEKYCR